jgi:type VI protein secretion system component VasK
VVLTLDGQVLNSTSAGGASKDFAWPGPTHGAKFAVSFGGPMMELPEFQGLWATFRLFGDADQFLAGGGSTYTLQWVPRQGQSGQPWKVDGKVVTLPFLLDLKGAPPIFQKGYFSGLRCIPDVAR